MTANRHDDDDGLNLDFIGAIMWFVLMILPWIILGISAFMYKK